MSARLREILVVDDNVADTFLHRETLQTMCVADCIVEAPHGQAALELLTERRAHAAALPELILLDVNMPVMDGWEFLNQAGADKLLDQSAIVMLRATSILSPQSIQADTPRQPDAWLDKPLEAAAVTRVIDALLPQPAAP